MLGGRCWGGVGVRWWVSEVGSPPGSVLSGYRWLICRRSILDGFEAGLSGDKIRKLWCGLWSSSLSLSVCGTVFRNLLGWLGSHLYEENARRTNLQACQCVYERTRVPVPHLLLHGTHQRYLIIETNDTF